MVSSPLYVIVSSTGKKRFVIDLRYLNGYLLKDSLKYENLRIDMFTCVPERILLVFISFV